MTAPKWTPGPWEAYASMVYANRPKTGGSICQVSEVRHSHLVEHHEPDLGSPDSEEIYANAKLIAAAPELYAALEAVQPFVEGEHFYDHPDCIQLRAALAKARGETP